VTHLQCLNSTGLLRSVSRRSHRHACVRPPGITRAKHKTRHPGTRSPPSSKPVPSLPAADTSPGEGEHPHFSLHLCAGQESGSARVRCLLSDGPGNARGAARPGARTTGAVPWVTGDSQDTATCPGRWGGLLAGWHVLLHRRPAARPLPEGAR